jgi:hypothetical protein
MITKQEILNYIFKSKDGASWNEVSEMLDELLNSKSYNDKITDHDLLKIADDWAKAIAIKNIGIRTAFASGYRLAEKQAKEVQLTIDRVRIRFSYIDTIALEKIKQEYDQEDIDSEDEIMQGEIITALAWYKQGIMDVLNEL